MSALECYQFAYNDDNYGVLVHDPLTGQTAAIDAGEAGAYVAALQQTGYQLSHIFITHHHWDHTDGLAELKQLTGAKVIGPANSKQSLLSLFDTRVKDNDQFDFAGQTVTAIATPGHTLDMINYYIGAQDLLFSGDSLFVLGCGRLFEGDGPMMWDSLLKLKSLPRQTVMYSAHEYSLANAAFAMTIDPENAALQNRVEEIKALTRQGLATVPSTLAVECETNPFLRADDQSIRAHLGLAGASDAEVFTEIRNRKDRF